MKSTKRALLTSGLCLMLTALMLVGSTFAWFTDSVVNEGNVIQSGTLDVRFTGYRWDATSKKWITNHNLGDILITEKNWEPGISNVAVVRASNLHSNLAVKVKMQINVVGCQKNLKDAIWVHITPIVTTQANVGSVVKVDELEYAGRTFLMESKEVVPMSEVGEVTGLEVPLGSEAGSKRYVYYVIEYGMYADAGNEYQDGSIDMEIGVMATQAAEEADGFGNNDYDAGATFPVSTVEDVRKAIANAKDGDVIALSDNLTVTDETVFTFTEQKALTLDLGGNTLTYQNPDGKGKLVEVSGGASLTLQNGTVTMTNPYYGLLVKEGSTLILKDLDVTSGDSCVFSHGKNTKVVVEGCTLSSVYYAVYHNGSYAPADITIRNTEIRSGGVYVSNSANREMQKLTIENSTIYGPTAVEIKHTNATITDSVLVGTSTPTGSGANNNGGCTEGYALAVTSNGETDLATGTITVTNCKFYNGTVSGEPNGYIFVYKLGEGASVTIDGESVDDYNSYDN